MNLPLKKRSYHPFILIAYHLNFLPAELQVQLPRSTYFDWKKRDSAAQFGYEFFESNKHLFQTLEAVANNAKFQTAIRVLIKLIALKRFITTYKFRIKDKIGSTITVVVNTIEKLKPFIPVTKCLHILQTDYKQYLSWRRIKNCNQSFINLCIIRHPHQLLKSEVAYLKTYVSDNRFHYWPLISVYHQMRRDNVANYCINTFYKYVNLLHLTRTLPSQRRKNHDIGIRTDTPLKLLHIDVTRVHL